MGSSSKRPPVHTLAGIPCSTVEIVTSVEHKLKRFNALQSNAESNRVKSNQKGVSPCRTCTISLVQNIEIGSMKLDHSPHGTVAAGLKPEICSSDYADSHWFLKPRNHRSRCTRRSWQSMLIIDASRPSRPKWRGRKMVRLLLKRRTSRRLQTRSGYLCILCTPVSEQQWQTCLNAIDLSY